MSIRSLTFLALLLLAALGTAWWLFERSTVYHVTVAAGSRHGEAYAVVKAIAETTHKYYPHIEFEVLETTGSTENMRLLAQGRVQMATVQADIPALPGARLVAQLYPDVFQLLVREESGIRDVADLKGHKIALPPKSSGQYQSFWFLAEHYGLSGSAVDALPMSAEAANFAFLAGAVDAVFRVRAPGNSSIRELIEGSPSRLIPIEQAAAMQLAQPAIELGAIPIGSYRGDPPLPPTAMRSATLQRLLIANADFDEEVVATVTGVLFERRRDLVNLIPLTGFIVPPDRQKGIFIPLHAGAERYYSREEPAFFQEHAELIALYISFVAILGSALLQLHSRRKKHRLDRYNRDLLRLGSEARSSEDPEVVRRCRDRVTTMVSEVVDDAEDGRISPDGFDIFSFTWEVVSNEINERESELRSQHRRHANPGSKRSADAAPKTVADGNPVESGG